MNLLYRNLALITVAASFAVCSSAHAVFLRGQPYIPAGANFSIFAVQGIDNAHPTGQTGFNPQVNGDFEFKDSIGVAYDNGSGSLTQFGLGLYNDSANAVHSTGLNIVYNTLVDANSVTIRVEDFDIDTKSTFFNPHKVEPVITIFGAGGLVLGTAQPTDIFPLLQATSTKDVWDINIGAVLSSLHISNTQISGFLLSADMNNGEIPNSDPYLLISIGRGTPVPEMGTLFPIVGLLVAVLSTQVLRRRKQQQLATLQLSSQ